MAENNKKINARIQLKNDISTNWDKAENFKPLPGEPIVVSDNKKKIKIGDGETVAKDLPFLLDSVPVEEGEGEKSVVIADGVATGDYSIAGGTVDKDIIKDLTGTLITPTLTAPEASGDMSLAFGANVEASSIGAMALGYDSKAGVKGYYWHDIVFNEDGSAKIYLAKTQTLDSISTSNSAFEADLKAHLLLESDVTIANLGWTAEDYISIVNDHKFPFCAQITNVTVESRTFTKSIILTTLTATVDCIVVTVDSLPFTAVDEPTLKLPDDKTIFAISRIWDDTYKKYNVTARNGAIELGWGALAVGSSNQAFGAFSSANGYNNTAVGDFGSAEGRGTLAGYAAHSEGYNTIAKGTYSHAEGHTSTASGEAAHSEGKDTEASGLGAHAQNVSTVASADAATAMGAFTQATANNALAMGHTTKASGNAALAGGRFTEAKGSASLAFGYTKTEGNIKASGQGAIAMGDANTGSIMASGVGSIAMGEADGSIVASGKGAVAIGMAQTDKTLTASGYGALALGVNTTASASAATAVGSSTTASGNNAFAEGHTTEAKGNASHTEGRQSIAYGQTSHAEGYKTKAGTEDSSVNYESAHAEGYETTAIGIGAHAEGYKTKAEGFGSHAGGRARAEEEGWDEYGGIKTYPAGEIRASGEGAFAHGYIYPGFAHGGAVYNPGHIIASGKGAFALGCAGDYWGTGVTEASGDGSFALGNNTEAMGNYSVAFGESNTVSGTGAFVAGVFASAYTEGSVAMGYAADAEGESSIALGTMVTATAPYQVVMGYMNNENDNAAFIIGDGENFDGNILEVIRPVEEVDYSALIAYGNIESLLTLPCEEFDGGDGNTYNQIIFNADYFYLTGGPLDSMGSPTFNSGNIVSEDGTTIIEPYASHLPTEVQHLVKTKKTPVSIKIGNAILTDTQLSQLLTLLPKTFTFYIDDNQYEAEEGMTWLEWIYSPYNIDGYVSQNSNYSDYTDYIWNNDTSDGAYVYGQGGNISQVHHSDTIIANYPYVLSKVN